MWPNPQIPADLVRFTEEVLNSKLHFLCSGSLTDVLRNNFLQNLRNFPRQHSWRTLFSISKMDYFGTVFPKILQNVAEPILCRTFARSYLIHFMSLVSFYTPWKHQKSSVFLTFWGVVERDQWHEIGLYDLIRESSYVIQKLRSDCSLTHYRSGVVKLFAKFTGTHFWWSPALVNLLSIGWCLYR